MYGYPGYSYPCQPYRRGGLVGVAGGILELTTTALQAGTGLVRTVVEGAVWQGWPGYWPAGGYAYPPLPWYGHHCGVPYAGHCYVIEHRPAFPPCC